MVEGYSIEKKRHVDFLNDLFHTAYKGWYKCCWNYDEKTLVWFVRFDNYKRTGYRNTIDESKGILCQENVDGKRYWNGKPINDASQIRLVFSVVNDGIKRKYIFKGVYQYIAGISDPFGKEYFRKVASEYAL